MRHSEHNFHNPTANVHRFAMIPRAEIPRSRFNMEHTHKTTFNASILVPIFLTEAMPGDTFSLQMTGFARMATPLFPMMDNLRLETFFFFVPNRLVWKHWPKMMGEQDNPNDSISFTTPQMTSPTGGYLEGTVWDYFGIPCAGQIAPGNTISHSALPLRAYALIYHQWFRDQNLVTGTFTFGGTSGGTNTPTDDDGPDAPGQYTNLAAAVGSTGIFLRGKRHDYFTGCLPWTQKGGVAVTLPLGVSATVKTSASELFTGSQPALTMRQTDNTGLPAFAIGATSGGPPSNLAASTTLSAGTLSAHAMYPTNLFADLSTATAATINSIRLAFQTQRLLERDARGGTRYTEIIRSHFGVLSPDSRLQRAEYLGGGSSPVVLSPVAQTAATGATGTTTPQGNLAAVGTIIAHGHGFRQSFTEHGHIIGMACITADLTYQQGLHKMWSRQTRYDYYWPVMAMLGEQAVLNKEIFADGSANDALTFGFQERWAEYRYMPSRISGAFRSTFSTPLDAWHAAQKFLTLPVLNATFILDQLYTTLARNLALGTTAQTNAEQFICDFFFKVKAARPMPIYSVPGLIDHL